MSAALEVRDLRMRFGAQAAIDGISFRLEPGRIHGLLGRNGAGKTTLLSLVASLRRPTSGSIRIDGVDPFGIAAAAAKVCLVPSGPELSGGLRVRAALKAAAALRPNWDAALAERLVGRFALPMKKTIASLSRGQRSAVGIVIGLASRAELTMFDEAYLGLDAPSRYAFYEELLQDYMAHPRTIVLSTHLIEEVGDLFEDVLILKDGRVLLQENAEQLRSRGAALVGPADKVDAVVAGLNVVGSRSLGPTKSVTVYGNAIDGLHRRAGEAGLQVAPVPLQDLFVHLTEPGAAS
ncbi:MAG: ABC transporter ATP-binding protein [Bauldia sp.]|nr:ABC transporter ATP-binding protein [Bauldia sp.]MCW5718099.1 ABC transporter ATP-binding protein [Bauldia sp.]